jgi:hypothetical protein
MKPVLYRYKDTESVIKHMDGYTPGEGWEPLFDEAAMKAATAAALERAALVCDEQAKEPECPERATYCADAIRALKDKA